MNVLEAMQNKILFFDGAMGTQLQARGLMPGELPELWNITHPDVIYDIHKAYLDAGCDILTTNTFGVNRLKFDTEGEYSVEKLICAAIQNAKKAASAYENKFVALDIGPCGKLLKPFGELDFEDAVSVFAEVVRIGTACGADLILIETMNDCYETKAAVLAAKENSDLPVFVTNVYDENMQLMTGAEPAAMVAMLEGLGVDALGVNCSLGPVQMLPVVRELCKFASVPVIVNPNAGLPVVADGKTVYDIDAVQFAEAIAEIVRIGARVVGGCCGTTPAHIEAAVAATKTIKLVEITKKKDTLVSSYKSAVMIDKKPVIIGERINPTGKKAFKEALRNNDIDYILGEGLKQQENGAHILDVNVGLPEIDECAVMCEAVKELQAIISLPLQIDTSDALTMERALRIYNGKALVNSVNGKQESMDMIFPLVKKYGGVVIALTLDEDGIPNTAEGRYKIAEKIYNCAKSYGIDGKDLIFDPLAMTVSADTDSALVTLGALKLISERLGCKTSLGVSNISFGLPQRELINSTFYAMALSAGLNAAILNPGSVEMMKTYHSFLTLSGMDENCAGYIDFASKHTFSADTAQAVGQNAADTTSGLQEAIVKGLKERASVCASDLLKSEKPLDIISKHIIPALDIVGKGFEDKTMFLPQLLMSAEASKAAFDAVKNAMQSMGDTQTKKGSIVLATVKGDIHDIGKNIVKVLLENYGFDVIDAGRDVPPEMVVALAQKHNAPLVGLSALMTTTVPSMQETIEALNQAMPACKVVVGGAVLTQEYADAIGADKYARDAMETVRYAEEIFGE